ncbi:MAG: hypothetical protein AAGI53_14370 [Planctomycetota bacterium]
MHHKPLPGLLRRPSTKPHHLQFLSSFFRRVVGSLLRRLPVPLGSEDRELALEQSRIGERVLPLAHDPHKGEGCASIRARAVVATHIERLANRSAKAHIDRFGVIRPCLPWDVRCIAGGPGQAPIRQEVTAWEVLA